jgi:hypothetical protein
MNELSNFEIEEIEFIKTEIHRINERIKSLSYTLDDLVEQQQLWNLKKRMLDRLNEVISDNI